MYKLLLFCLLVYLVLAPYIQIPDTLQYDSKRILQLFSFTVIGLILIAPKIQELIFKRKFLSKEEFIGSNFIFAVFGILFFAGLISVFQASHFMYAMLEFALFFLLVSLILIVTPTNKRDHYLLGKVLFATALLYSCIYLMLFFGNYISSFMNPMINLWPEKKYNFTIIINGVELVGKEVLYFDNKRFFNHTQTWTMPILLGFLTYYKGLKKNKGLEIILSLLVSFWWMLLFATGARGSLIGIIVSLIVLLFIVKKDAFQFLKNGITTFFLGGIFYVAFFKLLITGSKQIPLLRDFSNEAARLDLLEKGFISWWQNPFFGVGPMHNAEIVSDEPWFASLHNFYVQFLSEWGLIAFCALAILIVIFIGHIYKNYYQVDRNTSNRIVYLTFIWSLLAAGVHALFSGIMITPMSQIWFVLLISWFLGFNNLKSSKGNFSCNINYLKISYIILLTIVLWIASDNVSHILNHYSEYFSKYPESRLYPRFWIQGLFE